MFVDLNRTSFREMVGKTFLLENSIHTFLLAVDENDDWKLVDLDNNYIYDYYDVVCGCYNFNCYRKDDDEDYHGVWVIE